MLISNRIDLDNEADVLLWADTLSITKEQLREIVAKVGPMPAAVRFYASRTVEVPKAGAAGKSTPVLTLAEIESCRSK